MSITNLGKRTYLVKRHTDSSLGGEWVDGEWVETTDETVTIFANIQTSTMSYKTFLLPEGKRDKEAIAIYSNDWLYTARAGTDPREPDLVLYRGAEWEVIVSRPYGNFGQHCEAIAIKRDDSVTNRPDGAIGVIE